MSLHFCNEFPLLSYILWTQQDVGSQIEPLNTIQKAESSWIILEKFAYKDIPGAG